MREIKVAADTSQAVPLRRLNSDSVRLRCDYESVHPRSVRAPRSARMTQTIWGKLFK